MIFNGDLHVILRCIIGQLASTFYHERENAIVDLHAGITFTHHNTHHITTNQFGSHNAGFVDLSFQSGQFSLIIGFITLSQHRSDRISGNGQVIFLRKFCQFFRLLLRAKIDDLNMIATVFCDPCKGLFHCHFAAAHCIP